MAAYPKALEVSGVQSTDFTINIQPPVGKMWWFQKLRLAINLTGMNSQAQIQRYIGASSNTVTEKQWYASNGSIIDAGTVAYGCAATNGNYLRFTASGITASSRYVLTWFGVEVDI